MRRLAPVLLLVTVLTGCGDRPFGSAASAASTYAVESSYGFYHSYGDSITFGFELADPSTQAYPGLVAAQNHLTLSNNAISGDQACDVPPRQIFAHGDHPKLADKALYSLLISTNDVNKKGTGPYEGTFNLCHQASIAWLAMPEEWKVLASASPVTTSGATHMESAGNWNALVTDGPGATISVPFTRSGVGPVYVWYRVIDGSAGTFIYSLDGTDVGQGATQVLPLIDTQNGSHDSFGVIRLAAIASGAHVLNFQQTSAGAYGIGLVGVGVPGPAAGVTLPRVLVGTTPLQLVRGGGPCSVSSTPCDAYIADITENVNLFRGDGLDVELFDSRKYELGTLTDMVDVFHPNALGNVELFKALEDVLVTP